MILDNFQNWQLVWQQDYVAQTPAMRKNDYSATLVIGEIIIPVAFTSHILALEITNSNKSFGYMGYLRQKISGTFPAYVSESYRGFYLNQEPNVFVFDASITNFLISFVPVAGVKKMHLEIFEFLGS